MHKITHGKSSCEADNQTRTREATWNNNNDRKSTLNVLYHGINMTTVNTRKVSIATISPAPHIATNNKKISLTVVSRKPKERKMSELIWFHFNFNIGYKCFRKSWNDVIFFSINPSLWMYLFGLFLCCRLCFPNILPYCSSKNSLSIAKIL